MAHESETKGQLRKLHRAFLSALIHDLTEADFADTYAQTVTYGLLTAAISKTPPDAAAMAPGEQTALTQDDITAMVPVTNPFLKEMLQEFLKVGGRKDGVDFDELGINEVVELLRGSETDLPAILRDFGNRKPGEDPVIHFYEHFLAAYNKKLRIQRGVFYTPQPVVSYIVRSVHELLQTEFGLEDGLASTLTWGEFIQKSKITHPQSKISLPPLTDLPGETKTISPDEPFVQILDPATGTATFLVETIDVIFKHLKERWRLADSSNLPGNSPHFKSFTQYWNDYVPKYLLPRLHGYELMMAPYAIAHMKIGLKLAETGYQFGTEERARIYLTNALEPWAKQLPLIGYDALAHEAEAVNEIKRHKRFSVVIGNPPYSGISSNMSEHALRIVDAYRFVDGAPLNEKKLWLQDDYVKFIRISQTTVEKTGSGILGLITNNGYLDNPTFRGMRQSLMMSFSTLRLIDLHGNASKGEKTPDGLEDKNVFEIKQGVSIFLATKSPSVPVIQHSDIWGDQDLKYQWFNQNNLSNTRFKLLAPSTPYYAFVQQDAITREEYSSWISIWDVFGSYGTGVVTGRDALTIDVAKEVLIERLNKFASLSEDDARVEFELGPDARDWKVSTAQKDIRQNPPSISSLVAIQYRPFDSRWTHYTGSARGIYASPCRSTMAHMLKSKNLGLITARSNAKSANDHFFVTRHITEAKCGESSRQCALFPLRLFQIDETESDGFDFGQHSESNFSTPFLQSLKGLFPSIRLTPEDIFQYIYAIFYSPGWRSRYAEFLKIDYPRLPLTGNLALFRELSRLGGELVALHLLESLQLDTPITEFIGPLKTVIKPGWTAGIVWLDSAGAKATTTPGTSGFHGVPEAVWNFHIGGYQVCHKWLKDRKGRALSDEDIAHYHKIVIALTETIRLMAEIDQVIETHGGWPGAFQANL
jgi:predicted helicase